MKKLLTIVTLLMLINISNAQLIGGKVYNIIEQRHYKKQTEAELNEQAKKTHAIHIAAFKGGTNPEYKGETIEQVKKELQAQADSKAKNPDVAKIEINQSTNQIAIYFVNSWEDVYAHKIGDYYVKVCQYTNNIDPLGATYNWIKINQYLEAGDICYQLDHRVSKIGSSTNDDPTKTLYSFFILKKNSILLFYEVDMLLYYQ